MLNTFLLVFAYLRVKNFLTLRGNKVDLNTHTVWLVTRYLCNHRAYNVECFKIILNLHWNSKVSLKGIELSCNIYNFSLTNSLQYRHDILTTYVEMRSGVQMKIQVWTIYLGTTRRIVIQSHMFGVGDEGARGSRWTVFFCVFGP